MRIKRIKIFANNNDKSLLLKDVVATKLIKNDFEIVEDNFDLGIAIGGDGSFLRMIKDTNFDSNTYYIGINAGTLGFAQEVEINDIENFINDLKEDKLLIEEIGIQESTIYSKDDKLDKFYSLNEIVVREKTLNTLKLDVFIDNYLLENFASDGILVATSFGTTAYNLSFGGSIIYNTFHALELTTIAPLNNKTYKTISNSIVLPQNKNITLLPTKTDNLIVTVDGVNKVYDNVIKHKYFITNLGKCTQKDARALPDSIYKVYLDLFYKELEIVNPKVVILFGNQVSSIVLNEKISVSNCRKTSFSKTINNKMYKFYPVHYPIGNGIFNIDKAIEDIKWIIDTEL